MQSLLKQHLAGRCRPFSAPRHGQAAAARCRASGNGNGSGHQQALYPPAHATARTVVDIVSEGALATIAADGTPIGLSVAYRLDKQGALHMQLSEDAVKLANLVGDARCSLVVQPQTFPARAVASVTLAGTLRPAEESGEYTLAIDKCLYFGNLDGVSCRPWAHAPRRAAPSPSSPGRPEPGLVIRRRLHRPAERPAPAGQRGGLRSSRAGRAEACSGGARAVVEQVRRAGARALRWCGRLPCRGRARPRRSPCAAWQQASTLPAAGRLVALQAPAAGASALQALQARL
jgi:hypothetical protein